MKLLFTILILGIVNSASGQKKFDSAHVAMVLTTLPKHVDQGHSSDNIIKAIEAVDKKFRQITDTLFGFKSLPYTIFQTVLIETDDSLTIDPLTFGDKIHTSGILFYNEELNARVDRLANGLAINEKEKLYKYLKTNFDHFSTQDRKLKAQPVRIRYVKFPGVTLAQVGIDIYGTHYLWTIDRNIGWDVVKVEKLWVY